MIEKRYKYADIKKRKEIKYTRPVKADEEDKKEHNIYTGVAKMG